MRTDLRESGTDPAHMSSVKPHHGQGLTVALIIMALILAISFFYMTKGSVQDDQADKITHAADSVDRAAKAVGDAAVNSADNLKNQK